MAELSMQELMNQLWRVKSEISEINQVSKELNKRREDYEQRLIAVMNANGLDQVRNDDATFSIKTETWPVAKDWDAVNKWVLETGNVHIFMRRITSTAYNDILEQGEEIPGVEPWEKTSLRTKTR